MPATAEIITRCDENTLCISIDPTVYSGACWAVPLWGTHGLIGLFLLSEKRDGGLFTQEELEIARAGGERLIDTTAAMHLAKRLMTVQRSRLSESQVIDRRVRRTLHDDILPQLHAAMLSLSANPENADGLDQLAGLHRNISDLLHEMPNETASTISTHGLIEALRRVACVEYAGAFEKVNWQVQPEAEKIANELPATRMEVIYCAAREVIRNASRYGRGSNTQRPLHLQVTITGNDGLTITIEDDGVGIMKDNTTTHGAEQGILLHSTMMAVIGGSWTLETEDEKYTRVILHVDV
jgi:signal transduction histidine kinase